MVNLLPAWVPDLLERRGLTRAEARDLLIDAHADDEVALGVLSATLPTLEMLSAIDNLSDAEIILGHGAHRAGFGLNIRSDALPETVCAQAVGRPLSDLISHPMAGQGTIGDVRQFGSRRMHIALERETTTVERTYRGCAMARLAGGWRRRRRRLRATFACEERPNVLDAMEGGATAVMVVLLAILPCILLERSTLDGVGDAWNAAYWVATAAGAIGAAVFVANTRWMQSGRSDRERRLSAMSAHSMAVDRMRSNRSA